MNRMDRIKQLQAQQSQYNRAQSRFNYAMDDWGRAWTNAHSGAYNAFIDKQIQALNAQAAQDIYKQVMGQLAADIKHQATPEIKELKKEIDNLFNFK